MESLVKHYAFLNLSKEKIYISESVHPEEESVILNDLAILIPVLSHNTEDNDFNRLHTESGTWISILGLNRELHLLLMGTTCPIKWGIQLLRRLRTEVDSFGSYMKTSEAQQDKIHRRINKIMADFLENPEKFLKKQLTPASVQTRNDSQNSLLSYRDPLSDDESHSNFLKEPKDKRVQTLFYSRNMIVCTLTTLCAAVLIYITSVLK